MDLTLLKTFQALFHPNLEAWSTQVHGVALSLLAAAWLRPVLGALFRRWSNAVPDIEWVSLWRCPECNTYNRRATLVCMHCEYHLKVGGLAKWIPLWVSEMFKRGQRRTLFLYKFLGWGVFYAVTGVAFWQLRLYAFRQNPTQELLASTAILLLLAGLIFFRRAFLTWLKSPIGAVLDFFAGMVVIVLFAMNVAMWSATPGTPAQPLVYVHQFFDSWIALQKPPILPHSRPQSLPPQPKATKHK